jgi:mono/diheme cytochrome c family protein
MRVKYTTGPYSQEMKSSMRTLGKLIVAGGAVFVLLQVVRPRIPFRPVTAEIQAPPQIRQILRKDCYSCHSDERRLSWFDQIAPGYWLVRHDILTAREHLNFSTLGSKPAAMQKATLYEAVNMIQLGAMPLPKYLALHPEAKVTPEELATLKAYLAPWADKPESNSLNTAATPTPAPMPMSLATVQPELDGFPFDPSFEGWKPLSMTDRGDNNTFRFVLGNDIAVKAALAGNIKPWPDGARFAKIAWKQDPGSDGLLHPGKFVQVELMLKDAGRYKDTEGWGWGRWLGSDLKPLGPNAHFAGQCTSCHQPMRGNDYVYTLPISPVSLPFQPLSWSAITMYVDPESHVMTTLYGNPIAMQAVQPRNSRSAAPVYPPGAVLALVTWAEREDPHWFGARIPDIPQSVEFVQLTGSGKTSSYRRFAGTALAEDEPTAGAAAQRTSFVLGLAPASMP